MISFSGGAYLIGSRQGRADESPEHVVGMAPFEMDEFVVTVAQVYSIFDKAQLPLPCAWRRRRPKMSDLPAVNLTYLEASQLAELLGKQLPTEEQIEVASGGASGRRMTAHKRPGTGPLPLMTAEEARERGLVTPEGLVAMVGMIWHWTSSDYSWYDPGGAETRIPLVSSYRTVRGGVWSSYDARVSFRSFRDPSRGYERVGFRCVKGVGSEGNDGDRRL